MASKNVNRSFELFFSKCDLYQNMPSNDIKLLVCRLQGFQIVQDILVVQVVQIIWLI